MAQETPVQAVFVCSQCGRTLAQSDLVHIAGHWVCAECKPAFLSRVMAGGVAGASPLTWRYGGFFIRWGARIIDSLVLAVPILILAAVFIPNLMRSSGAAGALPSAAFAAFIITFVLISLLLGGVYEVLMLKYCSATLGKIACGLKVVRPDGRNLSWGVCFGRFFMWNIVTSGIPYINFFLTIASSIMVGVDNEKRALHDRICDTRVIHKQGVA